MQRASDVFFADRVNNPFFGDDCRNKFGGSDIEGGVVDVYVIRCGLFPEGVGYFRWLALFYRYFVSVD
jgi:hypothetical protein